MTTPKPQAGTEHDSVHSPKHYQIPGTSMEVIDVIEGILTPEQFQGYCYGNIIKYILRAPNKNGVEDLKKAAVYLEWLTLNLEDQQYREEAEAANHEEERDHGEERQNKQSDRH